MSKSNSFGFRRWLPWLALVILFSIATSLLSWWQFSRREERVEKINQVIQNYDLPPVSIGEISWVYSNGLAIEEWRPVNLKGSYLEDSVTLVRNRPLNGQAGFLQLIPFRLDNGTILIVERGWLPTGSGKDTPDFNPLPNNESKELVVRLRAGEKDLGRAEVPGQIASIDLVELASRFSNAGEVETRFYGRLVSENPASAELPFLMPKPSLSEGNHLSYALQWIIFGIMAFAAFIWAYRNERRIQLEEAGIIAPKTRRRTQSDIDAAIEDSISS